MKEKITAFFFAFLFFILYILIATDLRFYTYFTVFWPDFHISAAAAIVVFTAIYLIKPGIPAKIGEITVKYSLTVLPFAMFFITLAVNRVFIVSEMPDDGAHYVWLAKLIASGKFYLPLPDFEEHYSTLFMFMNNDKYTSIFLPGYSIALAPFAKLSLEYMFNPMIAGINTFLVGIHAEKLKNRHAALIAMLMFSASPLHIMHGALYFSHHFGLMLVLSASYLLLYKSEKSLNFFLSGLIVAYSLMMRPQNALYVYAAFVFFILARDKSLKKAALFTAPFIVTGFILMAYNRFFTGDPFIFTQDILFNAMDLKEFCHRPGLGKGCNMVAPMRNWTPVEGTTIPFLAHISYLRINGFIHWITFHPLMLLFIFPAIISKPYKYFLYYFTPLCALCFYFWFFLEGNYFGPRYLMESGAMILIPAACGFVEIYNKLINKKDKLPKIAAVSMHGFVAGALIFFMFFSFPLFPKKLPGLHNPAVIEKIIEENNIKNSIVMLPFHLLFHFESILRLQKNPPFDEHGNLIIYSRGEKSDDNIRKYYSEKDFEAVWKIEIVNEDIPGNPLSNRIFRAEKIPFLEDDGRYYTNFGHKMIPSDGSPQMVYVMDNSYNKILEDILGPYRSDNFKFDDQGIFIIFGEKAGQNYYGFEQSVKSEGTYDARITMIPTKCTPDFSIEINGAKSGVYTHENNENDGLPYILEFDGKMKSGKNKLKIVPHSNGCLILSDMILQKR